MMISLTKYVLQLLGFLLCYQMSSKYMSSKGCRPRARDSATRLVSAVCEKEEKKEQSKLITITFRIFMAPFFLT